MTRAASPHRLILASAGTGKTWQLSGHFLELLLRGVPPERILATTFTRKAAGEIFDRLLRRLVDALENPEQRAELAHQTGIELDTARVRAELARQTRRLDRFRVRTLDAFFMHLARLFAPELGLPADWTIVEDAEDAALRRSALALALARSERLEMVGTLRALQPAEAPRSVERVLLKRVEEGRNAFLDSHAAAWQVVVAPPGPAPAALGDARAVLADLAIPTTTAGAPNKTWTGEKAKLQECVDAGDWEAFLGRKLVQKALAGDTEYAKNEIPAELAAALRVLVEQARHVLLSEVAHLNRAARTWLERFEAAYEELKESRRAYRFEDLPKHLHPRDERRLAELDLVWYRLDTRLDHLLLDEFQDTSPVQWRILAHLADEILADGTGARSFFCVGDVKQSIYGWREAEPRLLAGLAERYPVLAPERLAESHRSSRIVLEAVGRVFGALATNAALTEEPERAAAARGWQADFEPLRAKHDLPGAVFLLEAPAHDEDEDEHGSALRLAAARAKEILDAAPAATLAILLRRNELLARTIYLLRKLGIRASDEGGNPLTDSPAVLHFLSLLHLADHPGDGAAAFHVATSPLGELAGLSPAHLGEGAHEARAEVARVVRRRLAVEGLGAFTSSFRGLIGRRYDAWDVKRFDQLVDLAYGFESRAGLRSDPFVDHVRITKVEDPSSNQVKVMTIHMAKGLEFDAVILPELDEPLAPRETGLLTLRPEPSGLLTSVSHPRSKALCRLDTRPGGLGELWSARAERETREALCLLYVAMTRARHRLDLIVKASKDSTNVSFSFAGILRAAFRFPSADAAGILWQHPENDAPWFVRRAAPSPAPTPRPPPSFWPARAPRALPRRTPSAAEGAGKLDARDLLRSPHAPGRVRGVLMHRWLAEVEWLEEFAPSDAELLELARPLTDNAALARETLAAFRHALARPNTRALLTRPAGADLEVWRERAFELVLSEPDGRESLWSGAFDRVVLERRGAQLERALVVDFKSDRVAAQELDQRVAFYRPQLASYRRVLARMTGLAQGAITARLLFLELDEVREA